MVHEVKMSFKLNRTKKVVLSYFWETVPKITKKISQLKESSWSRSDVTGCFWEITEEEEYFSE